MTELMHRKPLTTLGVIKGPVYKNLQHYTVFSRDDETGQEYLSTLACFINYVERTDKAFRNLFPLGVPREIEEEKPTEESIDGPTTD